MFWDMRNTCNKDMDVLFIGFSNLSIVTHERLITSLTQPRTEFRLTAQIRCRCVIAHLVQIWEPRKFIL